MKKLVSLVLCLVMLLTVAASAVAEVTPAGQYPITTEKETLKIAIPVNSKVEDMNTNQLTVWLEEKLNIEIEFVELNSADSATQVNMLMTSGDLPDIIMGYNFPYDALCNYADAGLIMPLDDLIAKYASEEGYNRFINGIPVANPEAYVTYDGHIYAMPSGGAMYTNMYAGYAARIQGAFLDALGMELPQTLEEFYNYLVAVRDGDPNGNGDTTDEIPFTSATHSNFHLCIIRNIGNAFQYTEPNNYLTVKDGTVSFIGANDLYKETVQWIKKLVDEDLLEPEAFTQDSATLASRHSENQYLMGAIGIGYFPGECMDTGSEAYKTLVCVPALEGPYGYKTTAFMPPAIKRNGVITTSCKNPDLAFRFLEFLLTEEASVAFRLGFEGTEWEKAPEGVNGRNGSQAKFVLLKAQEWIQPSTNVIWNHEGNNYCEVMNYVYDGADSPTTKLAASMANANLVNTVVEEYLPDLLISAEDALEYNELKTMITDYVSSNTLLFALGDRPMEDWDAYCAELEAMGVARYVEMAQAAYDQLFK